MPSKREIYHKPCEKCESSGHLVTRSKRKCTKCGGQGWLTVELKDIVCPKCDGDGKIENINTRECEECKGKGNFPRVVEEISCEETECVTCGGLGVIDSWKCSICIGAEIYDDWDGKRCKRCETRAIRVTTRCHECYGSCYSLSRTLKDIKTGEEYEVEEWAPRDEEEEEDY